jgi:hypothetical protein
MERTIEQSESAAPRWSHFRSLVFAVVVLGACYVLGFGPLLRYSSRTSTYADPWGNRYLMRVTPEWVRTLYQPMTHVLDQQPGSSSGKHGLTSAYRRYIEWWLGVPPSLSASIVGRSAD